MSVQNSLEQGEGLLSTVGDLTGEVGGFPRMFSGPQYHAAQGLGAWAATLQPASWRGCGFAVLESIITTGRRTAVHEYPYRDEVWVEDLGLGTRVISFRGFIVGDDVYSQRDKVKKACETPGAGTLVHPSLGSVDVANVSFSMRESFENGRIVELEFSFIETGQPLYPATVSSTSSTVTSTAASTNTLVQQSFVASIKSSPGQRCRDG